MSGMLCPQCRSDTTVKDSRTTGVVGYVTVRRRRLCLSCEHRFTTFELHEDDVKELPTSKAKLFERAGQLVDELSQIFRGQNGEQIEH